MSQIITNSPLTFTDSAATKVYQLIQEEGNPDLNLRVFISGGGCSGFQYGFTFDDKINQGDTIVEKQVCNKQKLHQIQGDEEGGDDGDSGSDVSVKLLIDPMSFQYLQGAEIDYREDLGGSRFVIRNPNAQTTCGCGSSFSA